jgi:hypothetical protein
LASQELSGSAASIAITPSYLSGWGILTATLSTPSGTAALVRVGDAAGIPLSDSVLSGNVAGFSSFPVSLTGIPVESYPILTLSAELTSNSTTTAPEILDWSLSYTDGPTPLSNVSFSLRGAKTIGTDASNAPIYKTTVNDTTGAGAVKTKTLEWDSYSLTLGETNLLESCSASPYSLQPGSSMSTNLLAGTPTTNSLPIVVENNASSTVTNAKVVLTRSGYVATIRTSLCGFAFFNGLFNDTYDAVVSATGYATTTFPNINVDGNMTAMTLILP